MQQPAIKPQTEVNVVAIGFPVNGNSMVADQQPYMHAQQPSNGMPVYYEPQYS
jgi:hypothetical protein